ncbi:MAG: alpha/beta hydrolase [Steroidobacteraceae bacterium]
MQRGTIDAEYNPELRVESRAPFIDWYVRRSALARAQLACRLDVPFGPTTPETLDLFPAATPRSPILLFIHGGYWRALSSKEFSFVASGLVPLGVSVAVMNYALCPQVTIAEISRQSRAAIAWLARNAEQLSGDPSRIFAAGHSAGGQQVGMLLSGAHLPQTGAPDSLKGGVAISGLFDLRPLQHSWLQPTLELSDALCAEQSPALHIPARAAPLLVSVGGEESAAFIGQSQDYHAAWTAAGLEARYLPLPGANHYEAVYGLDDPQSLLTRAVMDLIG